MDKSQNIYDDETFFAGYRKLRENPDSFNALLEQPAFLSLVPSVAGKRVLDLGCGFGDACREYERRGAAEVVGLDLSEKMLARARELTDSRIIRYVRHDLAELGDFRSEGPFDLAAASLAFHYVEDFAALMRAARALLRDGGVLLFSQEHPLTTAPLAGPGYLRDENGRPLHYKLTDYNRPGPRRTTWFVDNVLRHHRTFAEILNALPEAGFRLDRLAEPTPSPEAVAADPEMAKEFHKPSFLIVRAVAV